MIRFDRLLSLRTDYKDAYVPQSATGALRMKQAWIHGNYPGFHFITRQQINCDNGPKDQHHAEWICLGYGTPQYHLDVLKRSPFCLKMTDHVFTASST
jgi:hypothetical protein